MQHDAKRKQASRKEISLSSKSEVEMTRGRYLLRTIYTVMMMVRPFFVVGELRLYDHTSSCIVSVYGSLWKYEIEIRIC